MDVFRVATLDRLRLDVCISMAEKSKLYDGIMLRRGLSKFDATLLSNDGGQYSPSIRRIVCYLKL